MAGGGICRSPLRIGVPPLGRCPSQTAGPAACGACRDVRLGHPPNAHEVPSMEREVPPNASKVPTIERVVPQIARHGPR